MSRTISIPVKSIEVRDYSMPVADGEKETKILPEVGDPVDFSVKGTVKEIKDGQAVIHVAFVNGKRCEGDDYEEPKKKTKKDEDAEEEAELKKAAQSADEEEGAVIE